MDGHGERWCGVLIIGILGLISAAFGFAAEATKLKRHDVEDINEEGWCTYPRHPQSPALGFGIAATIALAFVRVAVLWPRSHYYRSSSTRYSLLFSWLAWFGAMSLFVAGFVMVKNLKMEIRYEGFVKPGIFGAGAFLALLTASFEMIYWNLTHNSVPPASVAMT